MERNIEYNHTPENWMNAHRNIGHSIWASRSLESDQSPVRSRNGIKIPTRAHTVSSTSACFTALCGSPTCTTCQVTDSRAKMSAALAVHRQLDLTGLVLQEAEHPRVLGGYCDIYCGLSLAHGRLVAIRRVRLIFHQGLKRPGRFAERLVTELCIWSTLRHRNVLPLLGFITNNDNGVPDLVSPWMENGTVVEYLSNNPTASILDMVKGIADGLSYLHEKEVVHSDMKSNNVLVSRKGIPLLADFGISRFLTESGTDSTSDARGSTRWMAPELLSPDFPWTQRPKSRRQLEKADVWAFGMTVYELLAKEIPYFELKNDAQVILAINRGLLPTMPECVFSSTEESAEEFLWGLCKGCWLPFPDSRPIMNDVTDMLKNAFSPPNAYEKEETLVAKPFERFKSIAIDDTYSFSGTYVNKSSYYLQPQPKVLEVKNSNLLAFKIPRRPREVYANAARRTGPSLLSRELKKRGPHLSFKQQIAIADLFSPSANDRSWRKATRKSTIAEPISSVDSCEQLLTSEPSPLLSNCSLGTSISRTQSFESLDRYSASTWPDILRGYDRLSRRSKPVDYNTLFQVFVRSFLWL